ncbi:L,D-transpeptidase [Gemmobacter caeruleus]|uniref:L,D-transpeptidase n=1 Tax=Gemmobacter caeruleus TaxID=2595004 RepID=UPI0011EEFA7D|nr:L,D-transpeptidase [Gemmobacter caeruleus]
MLFKMRGLMLGTALIGALAACVPATPSVTEATKTPEPALPQIKQPVPEDFVNAYVARQDDGFVVPAVPEDKVPAHLRRQEVAFASTDPVGTIIIDPSNKTLHLVTGPGKAMRYGIAVGKDGFQWAGEALITSRKHWPTWTPPKEMIARKPELEKWKDGQPGGPTNPLGARALYLTTNGVDYGFRIHGTPEWQSIGRNASSGCFRMINQDVMDLYDRVPDGVKVVVLNADGSRPTSLKLPPPQPVKPVKKATPKPAAAKPAPVSVAAPGAPAPGFPTMTAPILTPPRIDAPAVIAPAQPAAPAPLPVVTPAPVVPATPAPAVTPAAPAPAVTCVPTAEKPCP